MLLWSALMPIFVKIMAFSLDQFWQISGAKTMFCLCRLLAGLQLSNCKWFITKLNLPLHLQHCFFASIRGKIVSNHLSTGRQGVSQQRSLFFRWSVCIYKKNKDNKHIWSGNKIRARNIWSCRIWHASASLWLESWLQVKNNSPCSVHLFRWSTFLSVA